MFIIRLHNIRRPKSLYYLSLFLYSTREDSTLKKSLKLLLLKNEKQKLNKFDEGIK